VIIAEYGYSGLPDEIRDAYDLDPDESLYILYGHMSSIFSRRGNIVQSDIAIGRTGSTGNSSGPHLHAEFRTGPSGSLWSNALCTSECRSASETTPWEIWRYELDTVDPEDTWE
jgi:murein DD-endopeptidase MepM/ murein hydrolase activator NlpD